METIKINRNSKIHNLKELKVLSIKEIDGMLLITLDENVNYRIGIGQEMLFRRYVYDDRNICSTIDSTVTVIKKDTTIFGKEEHDAVYTTLPTNTEVRIDSDMASKINILNTQPRTEDSAKLLDAYFDKRLNFLMVKTDIGFEPQEWVHYYSGNTNDGEHFVIKFVEDHSIFAQDIDLYETLLHEPYTIDVKNENGDKIGKISGIKIPKIGSLIEAKKEDTIECRPLDNCGVLDVGGAVFTPVECKYSNTPYNFSRNMIMFSSASTIYDEDNSTFFDSTKNIIKYGKVFSPRFNPFYYTKMEDGWKTCVMWHDSWWAEYSSKNNSEPRREFYVNGGNSRVAFSMVNDYWHVPFVGLSDDGSVFDTETAISDYSDRVIDEQIPAVVDMERFKYRPVISSETDEATQYNEVDSIIIDMHFRERAAIEKKKDPSVMGGVYPIYDDGWHVDTESGNTIWWNGFDYSGSAFQPSDFKNFVDASGKTSDLIGYLGFSDDDVYYRKSKIEKSFIRLSFFTSKDPIEQKLLYYSTIFMDPTNLYGKYMKQYLYKYEKYGPANTAPIVFMPGTISSEPLNTEVVIRSEAYPLASSEGFNLYLFSDDSELVDIVDNVAQSYRTIYMKAEFNHAGYGKTIPMMIWAKDKNGNYRAVTSETFLDDLYIRTEIRHLEDGRYVYSFPDADVDGNQIRLILFEPKLDINEELKQG